MPPIEKPAKPVNLFIARPPQNDAELWAFVKAVWGVKIPRTSVCKDRGHCSPFDAFADAYFGRSEVAVWHASRGYGGKSYLMALLGLTEAVTLKCQVIVLGGSGAQSQRVLEAMVSFWEQPTAPDLLSGDPYKSEHKLRNGGRVLAIPASQKSVRGPHPPRLHVDECDELDLEILDAAMPQVMDDRKNNVRAHVVLSSTWQYPDGTFTEVKRRANDQGWSQFTWCIASGSLVLTNRGPVPIEKVTDQDVVFTRKGWRHVQHVTFMGYKPTIALNIGNRILRCTPDHRIATPEGWRHAGALAADSMAAIRANPSILGSEFVSLAAKGGTNLMPPRTSFVLGMSDNVQMLDLDTRTIATQVVNRESFGNWTDYLNPDPSMSVSAGLPRAIGLRDALDSVATSFTTWPVYTLSGEHRNIVLPVWDIGVEDEHEFVVEGVLVHNCYRESMEPYGWLTLEEVERQKKRVSPQTWAVEVEGQEPNAEGRAFVPEKVDQMFVTDKIRKQEELWPLCKLDTIKGAPNYYLEFEPPEPGGRYATGADWAKEKDWTIIVTIRTDVEPNRVVAYERIGRRPWPLMVERFDTRVDRYPGGAAHDATGKGNVVADLMRHNAEDVVMVGRARQDMLTDYISAVEQELLISPRIEHAYFEHKYCQNSVIYSDRKDEGEGSKGHLPDSVAAFALAWKARKVNYRARAYVLGTKRRGRQ